ncbi:MAG: hypothetical protein HIU91_00815 [Acidobacteria bacterium]|nr:hypothetical protein [Acidobacteriota bacterium]
MKLDLSTVFLVILCVIPGLFAQRGRNLVRPRSFENQGATTELGELVALGITTHVLLFLFFAFLLLLAGVLHWNLLFYFHQIDRWHGQTWATTHVAEGLSLACIYVFLTFAVSHWLGVFYGTWTPLLTAFGIRRIPYLRRRVRSLIGERPIVYEAFSPRREGPDNTPNLVFVEVEMKGGLGFYAGQLHQFSILSDEEPHKPIYLANAWFKLLRADEYQVIEADGILLDLAETVQVSVRQTSSHSEPA